MRTSFLFIAMMMAMDLAIAENNIVLTHEGEEIRLRTLYGSGLEINAQGGIKAEIEGKDFYQIRQLFPNAPQRYEQFELAASSQHLASVRTVTPSSEMLTRVKPTSNFSPSSLSIDVLVVDRAAINAEQRPDLEFYEEGTAAVPFVAKDSVLLKLADELTAQDLSSMLDEHEFELLAVLPEIQSIHVRGDLSRFAPEVEQATPSARISGLADMIRHFSRDPRIVAVAPDLVISSQRSLITAEVVDAPAEEATDWGIENIGAPALWELPRAQDGAVIGIVDTGFSRHEDLVFSQTPLRMEVGSHGTHVAGIACARHGNGKGLRGVLPNCFVVPRAEPMIHYQGQDIDTYMALFSQLIGDLNEITRRYDGVRVFNVSLGYNWKQNMGIDPLTFDARDIDKIVASHGEFTLSIIENAAELDMVIYSAAGNDSSGNDDRRSARLASPFNWAAIEAKERNMPSNAFIVEAHDQDGARADFSNTGGHLSCPGVNILSTVGQQNEAGQMESLYGRRSGTSMASPYCAAAHQLLSLVRPQYSNIEIASCLMGAGADGPSDVPQVNLPRALEYCPEKPY